MKTLLALLVLSFTSVLMAAPIYEQRFQACNSWSYTYNQGMNGYICSFFPQSISVPDTMSVVNNFNELEDRIDDLERKVEALQKALTEK